MMIEALEVRCPYCKRRTRVEIAKLTTFADGSKTITCGPPCGMMLATIKPDGSFLNTNPSEPGKPSLCVPCDFEITINAPAGGGGIVCPRCKGTKFEPYATPTAVGVSCAACGYFIGGGGGAPGGHATVSNGQAYGAGGGGGGSQIDVSVGRGGAGGLDPGWEAFLNGNGPDPRHTIYVRGLPHTCKVTSIEGASVVLNRFAITGEARDLAMRSIVFLFSNQTPPFITLAPEH